MTYQHALFPSALTMRSPFATAVFAGPMSLGLGPFGDHNIVHTFPLRHPMEDHFRGLFDKGAFRADDDLGGTVPLINKYKGVQHHDEFVPLVGIVCANPTKHKKKKVCFNDDVEVHHYSLSSSSSFETWTF